MKTLKSATIYGLDSRGNVKVKHFIAKGDTFITRHGRLLGNLTDSEKQCHDKNIGKSNESLAEDQAMQMVDRGVKKDTEQNGYAVVPEYFVEKGAEAIKEYLLSTVVDDTPMLAYPYKEEKADYKNGVLCSRKLDGIRCVSVFRNGKLVLQSRKQKPITTMEHIRASLEPVMANFCKHAKISELKLDGELYNHEYHDNFEELVSAIKKYRPGTSELLKFNIYGVIDTELCALDRYSVQIDNFLNVPHCEVVEQIEVYSHDDVMRLHKEWTAQGYEGAMTLNSMSLYQQRRSYDLMKVKEFTTEEFEIVNVIPMEAKPNLGLIVLRAKNGEIFKATPKCDEAKKAWYLENKVQLLGKQGTVQYFSLTKAGVPRLPVFISVRDYE